jgi:hydrogenase maturation protease
MVTFVCLGNEFRNDDAVGIYIGHELEKRGFNVIFAYTNPEVILSKIPGDEEVYFVDAADFEEDGPFIIGRPKKLSVSTHSYSLDLLERFLGKEILVAGIKTYDHKFGEEITEKAKSNADSFISYVLGISRKG